MRLLLAVALAACTSAAAAPREEDRAALDYWHKLAPRWKTWRAQRRTVPHDLERSLARAVLRGGNFACPERRPTPAECRDHFPARDPAPNAGFDDPCMRRVLATWALRMLSEDEIAEMRDDLVPLAAMAAPEDELGHELIDRVARVDRASALPLFVAAGRARVSDPAWLSSEVGELSPAAQQQARAAHLYKDALDWNLATDIAWMLEEANDPLVNSEDRLWPIRRIAQRPMSAQTHAAIAQLAADPDCKVAMGAATLLALAGDASLLPQRPLSADPAANARVICMASQDTSYLDTSGTIGAQMQRVFAAYHASPPAILLRCSGPHCTTEDHTATLELAPARDGGVYLARVDIRASTCGDGFEHAVDDYDFDLMDADDAGDR